MEKTRLKRSYIAACTIYLGVTILYGVSLLFFLLSEDAPEWELEGAAFAVYLYAIGVSPAFYLYEFSLYRLRSAGSGPALSRGVGFVHNFWRVMMWMLVMSASLLSLCWTLFELL